MFLCLYTVAILEYLELLRMYTITAIISFVFSKCPVHFNGAHPSAQAKHSSLDFLIMVDESPYFWPEQKFLDSFLIVVYDSIYFVWDFIRKQNF